MAENDELDELDEQDDDEQQYDGDDGGAGVVESLMSRLGDNGRSGLKPVVSAAAVAAATYVARNGPQLLKELGGDKAREKVGHARERGGVTGLAAGAAKRALSGSGGSLVERLAQGGELGKVADKLSGSGKGGAGWGDGRRLPIMQAVDVGAPVATGYNQWTQLEEDNAFLHRVGEVEQRSAATVTWHENTRDLHRARRDKVT